MSAQKLSGLSSRAVTLPFVFDGFKDHRENEQTEQRGDDDGINHGASSKGFFRSSPAPAQPVCQSRDIHKDCFGVLPIPHLGVRGWSSNPSVEGGWIRWVAPDHLVWPFIPMTHEPSSLGRLNDALDEAE